MRASAEGMMPVYSDDADPVTEVIKPSLMVVGLIPGALAVRACPPLVGAELPEVGVWELAVVAVLEPLLELPHARRLRARLP